MNAEASLRLFLGLWPSAEVLEQLVEQADAWTWPAPARRVAPQELHITLHFLGSIPAGALPSLRAGLRAEWEGCVLVLDRCAVWSGGVAVLEASELPAPLERLHAALGEDLQELGVAVEGRRWRPHVTLARKAQGAEPPPPAQGPPLRWHAGPSYALVRSLGNGRGYETIQTFG